MKFVSNSETEKFTFSMVLIPSVKNTQRGRIPASRHLSLTRINFLVQRNALYAVPPTLLQLALAELFIVSVVKASLLVLHAIKLVIIPLLRPMTLALILTEGGVSTSPQAFFIQKIDSSIDLQ